MEQYTDSQYDDDLTIGADEYDDSIQTNDVDLFEFGGDEDSTISRLKMLVLSIDWEITDEVLLQFNDEIQDLKDIWSGEKIQMVYLQALEKIGKYIYRKKADSHPDSIRLLLSLYYNLERIVLSDELSDADKKQILFEDVRRFEKLKKKIGKEPEAAGPAVEPEAGGLQDAEAGVAELLGLKAIVLGIDWEITENDLLGLREEVMRLEEKYADSRPRLVFLQGIGTLSAYIRKKQSNAHVDAFKLLHSFYEGLEKLVRTPGMTLEEEKAVLRPEVQKFNAFKEIIADTLARKDVETREPEEDETAEFGEAGTIAPAFADLPEDETHGFQEEAEVAAMGLEVPVNVNDHISKFFGEDNEEPPVAEQVSEPPAPVVDEEVEREAEEFSASFFDSGVEEVPAALEIDRETALQGVDVETEADDDSEEEALPVHGGEIAPALLDGSDMSAFSEEGVDEMNPEDELANEITGRLDDFFGAEEGADEEEALPAFEVPADVALQGVDVETEDDEEEDDKTIAEFREAGEAGDTDEIAPAFAEIEEALEEPKEPLAETAFAEITPDETFEEIPAALFNEEEAAVEEAEADVDEAAVEQQFDKLFAATPEREEEIPAAEETVTSAGPDLETEPGVEELVDQFFALEEDEPVVAKEAEAAVEDRVDEFFSLQDEPAEVVDEGPSTETSVRDQAAVEAEEEVEFKLAGGEELIEQQPEEEFAAVFAAAEEDVLEKPVDVSGQLVEEAVAGMESLTDLRGCVQSVSLELDDAIIQGLFDEIHRLRQRCAARPLEKTFLQLLSTVAQHIDQYRYGANDESNALLSSIMDNLEKSQTMETSKAQEALLATTCEVLQWQQKMLNAQAVRGEEGHLAFVGAEHAEVAEEKHHDADIEEGLGREVQEAQEAQKSMSINIEDSRFTDIVRHEIDSLRDTLKKEIAELRKAMKIDGDKE